MRFLDPAPNVSAVSLTFYPAGDDSVTLSFAGATGLEAAEVTAKGYAPTGAAVAVCETYAVLGVLSTTKPSTKKDSD